jgi:hypothetical protein
MTALQHFSFLFLLRAVLRADTRSVWGGGTFRPWADAESLSSVITADVGKIAYRARLMHGALSTFVRSLLLLICRPAEVLKC